MQLKEAKQAIKARLNITTIIGRYVKLQRQGSRFVAPCPFHQETKPSFTVNEEQGLFYCFGCQAKGDVITFYSQINGIDFRQALTELAKEAGITIDSHQDAAWLAKDKEERRQRLVMQQISTYTAKLFCQALHNENDTSTLKRYLKKRGLSPEICAQFKIGWAHRSWDALAQALQRADFPLEMAVEAGLLRKNSHGKLYDLFRGRLMFPITTFPDQVIAFGGRIIEDVDEPKYINSSDTPIYHKGEHLYGLVQAAPKIRTSGFALLTEGYMDVVTLHQFGYTNAVGVLGTSLTNAQIQRLTKSFTSKIVLLFDGDAAGRKAALRACQMILPQGISCRVVLLPEPEDIDSLLRLEHGPALFDDLLKKAMDGLDFFAASLQSLAPREMIAHTHEFLHAITVPELFSFMVSALARKLGLSEQALRSGQAGLRRKEEEHLPGIYRPPAPPPLALKLNVTEREILMFAARYPEERARLKELGAEHIMKSQAAQSFWAKLDDPEHAFELFNSTEQALWNSWCGKNAPPKAYDQERGAILQTLARCAASKDRALVARALRRNTEKDDFAADLVYLRAFQQTLEESGSMHRNADSESSVRTQGEKETHE